VSGYDLQINRLASYNTKITETFALADANSVPAVGVGQPFNAGILTLGAAQIDVALADGDTLNQVVAKINAVADDSKVRASILQVADGEFRLVLKTTETGAAYNYELQTVYQQVGNEIVIEAEAFQSQPSGERCKLGSASRWYGVRRQLYFVATECGA
jgi:hypothetical protein